MSYLSRIDKTGFHISLAERNVKGLRTKILKYIAANRKGVTIYAVYKACNLPSPSTASEILHSFEEDGLVRLLLPLTMSKNVNKKVKTGYRGSKPYIMTAVGDHLKQLMNFLENQKWLNDQTSVSPDDQFYKKLEQNGFFQEEYESAVDSGLIERTFEHPPPVRKDQVGMIISSSIRIIDTIS